MAVDSISGPAEKALRRATKFMGGLRIKASVKALAAALSMFVRCMCGKIEELGIACGFGRLSSSLSSLSSTDLSSSTENKDPLTNKNKDSSRVVAEWFGQQLDQSELDSRVMITSALHALQAIGRLVTVLQTLESLSSDLLGEHYHSLFDTATGLAQSPFVPSINTSLTNSTSVGLIYTAHILQQNRKDASLSEMKSFLSSVSTFSSLSSPLSQSAFAGVSGAPMTRLKLLTGTLLFDLCSEAPEKMVSTLASEEIWMEGFGVIGNSVDRDAIRETLLPQSRVTQVGEHLLSLVQELESFASSDALPDVLMLQGK